MRSSAQSRILPRGLAVLVFTCSLALLMGALVLVGCGSSTTSTTAAGSGEIQPGGILSVATEPATNRDPAFASGRADILINQQVYDWLVEVDQANQLIPGLATNW